MQFDELHDLIRGDLSRYSKENNMMNNYVNVIIRSIFEINTPISNDLKKTFAWLCKLYLNERLYYDNIDNLDYANVLASKYQSNSRYNNYFTYAEKNILKYSRKEYISDIKNKIYCFDPIKILRLVDNEIDALSNVLCKVPGYDDVILRSFYNENGTLFSGTSMKVYFASLLDSGDWRLCQAVVHIIVFSESIGQPLFLHVDGLHCVNSNEQATITFDDVLKHFGDIQINDAIIQFGQRCFFLYN